jgi:hypothetical protein
VLGFAGGLEAQLPFGKEAVAAAVSFVVWRVAVAVVVQDLSPRSSRVRCSAGTPAEVLVLYE